MDLAKLQSLGDIRAQIESLQAMEVRLCQSNCSWFRVLELFARSINSINFIAESRCRSFKISNLIRSIWKKLPHHNINQAEEDAKLRAMLARSAAIELKMDRLQRSTFARHCKFRHLIY